jgi:acyl-homoserine-lactone acylase
MSLYFERSALSGAVIGRCLLSAAIAFASMPVGAKTPATVSITMTPYGIPHIVASDYRGLGVGYGYTMAGIDACGMDSMFATYSGRRALQYGEQGDALNYLVGRRPINNVASDAVTDLMMDAGRPKAAEDHASAKVHALMQGYASGFNRFLSEHSAQQRGTCLGGSSPQPITTTDVRRRMAGVAMLLSSGLVMQELYDAAPPTGTASKQLLSHDIELTEQPMAGSNAYGLGKDATDNGHGLLLGNPHFFWDGPNRFVEMHLTIPGEYDAMGVTLQGVPLINIGFNRSLAWSHTVSTDLRGAVYRLQLDPNNPTRYRVDGRSLAMSRKIVKVSVRSAQGKVETRSHTFWMTTMGPVLMGPGMPWTRQYAYVLTDSNQGNDRLLDQWLSIGRSHDVNELKGALESSLGLPWVNTIAADQSGHAFYADLSVAPNLDKKQFQDCRIDAPFIFEHNLALLDGSRSACRIRSAGGSTPAGVLPASARPSLLRTDYVANSNGSHWLTNSASLLEGFSPVIGSERSAQSLRTRQGQIQIEDRLSGRDGLAGNRMSASALEQILFSDRSLQGEEVMKQLLAACAQRIDSDDVPQIKRGCAALSHWNRRYELDSVGAHLFNEFAARAKSPEGEDLGTTAKLWRVPFDATDPVRTPRDFDSTNPAVWDALLAAVNRLDAAQLPLEAKLGDVQFVVRKGQRIPMHGGSTFSAFHATLVPNTGYTDPIAPSNSYIQVVTFDASGPVADAILASSQTPDENSPHSSDQTVAYSHKQWIRLPFTPEQIAAEAEGAPVVLNVEN